MSNKVTIAKVEFENFKALKDYTVLLEHMNILVGPNNSGKSTTISAFRALGVGIKLATSKKATIVNGPGGNQYGYYIPEESLPMSLENVHTNYDEIDSTISFTLTNENKIILYFSKEGGCNLLTDVKGQPVKTPAEFKIHFPIKLEIVPVLGPIEQNEQLASIESVKKSMTTNRASRFFRNYWRFFPEGFEEFADLVSKTWSGMTIEAPKKPDVMSQELIMFCNENRILRELYWSGFGFQVWCQLLTHISRSKNATLLIVDEPEVYLHPDVQRQLLGILRYCGPDIIIASHSKEILEEADASEILMINKNQNNSNRLNDVEGIQEALDHLGSVQNVNLTHLARTKRLLFVDCPNDYKLLRKFAKQANFNELSLGNDITAIVSGGFSKWDQIKSFSEKVNKTMHIGAIFDKGNYLNEVSLELRDELDQHLEFSHIYEKQELENYLLNPSMIKKAVEKAIQDRYRRTGNEIPETETIHCIMLRITEPLKEKAQRNIDTQSFEENWSDLKTRIEMLSGKEVLKLLRAEIRAIHSVNLTEFMILDEFTIDEFPDELRDLIVKLENFRKL